MKRTHLACAALMLFCLVGCSGQAVPALTASASQGITDAKTLQADVEATNATAKALLATMSATQPTYKPLAATTQALTTVDVNMSKALDISSQLVIAIQAAQTKGISDPQVVAAITSIGTSAAGPYAPFVALGVPLILTIIGWGIHANASGKTNTTLATANVGLTSSLADAHAALGDAKATIAAATATPSGIGPTGAGVKLP